eukprot:1248426-Karenia_brevis.AAC.1
MGWRLPDDRVEWQSNSYVTGSFSILHHLTCKPLDKNFKALGCSVNVKGMWRADINLKWQLCKSAVAMRADLWRN